MALSAQSRQKLEVLQELAEGAAAPHDGIGFGPCGIDRHPDALDEAIEPELLPGAPVEEQAVGLQLHAQLRKFPPAETLQDIAVVAAGERIARAGDLDLAGIAQQRENDCLEDLVQAVLLVLPGQDELRAAGRAGKIAALILRHQDPHRPSLEADELLRDDLPVVGVLQIGAAGKRRLTIAVQCSREQYL